MAQIGKGMLYVLSIRSVLKLLQFISLLVAIGSVGYFLSKAPDGFFTFAGKKGYLQFLLAVAVIGWLLVGASFCFFVSGLHDRFPAIKWPLYVAIVSATLAVLLLISSSLVTTAVRRYDTKKITISSPGISSNVSICDFLIRGDTDYKCTHVILGMICGFIAMVLFFRDASDHLSMYLARESPNEPRAPAVPT